ncbi:hypothetical protein R1flu_007903 [Riccia fluitans]|uniref:Uncharacterized protein n=1 Tax=Riccia fluitans TaxID=41844 RepID=A0ABD1Z057_9MARC
MTKIRHRKSRWQDPSLAAGSAKQIQHKFYPLYAFGFEGIRGKRGQIACLDSNLIVYSIAGNVIFHNVSSEKSMRFFSSSVMVEAIVWLTSSPAGNFVAACERLKTGYHQLTIIDVKKLEAVQTIGGLATGEYGACAFAENERLVISACNFEETSQVEYWDIRDGRVLMASVVPYTINKITINPRDDEESAMSGSLHFKFWNIKGGAKKETSIQGFQASHEPKMTLTDHVWLADSSVAISTAEGVIFIVRENAVQHKYVDTGCTICLYSTGRELFCGRSDGTLTQYTGFEMAKIKMQEKESPYAEVKCITLLSGYSQISSIAMPPHGQKLLYLVEGETVLKVHLDIADDDDAIIGSEPNLARPVRLSVFGMKKITGMDVFHSRRECDEEPQLVTGHTGVVTTLAWSADSVYIVSAGADGAIYAWFLDGPHRYLEYVIKGSVHTCLLFDPARTYIIACGPKLPIKVLDTDKRHGLSHGKETRLLPEELSTPVEPDFETLARMYGQSPRESEEDSSVLGELQGSVQESHRGSVQGSIRDSIQGSRRGSIQGSHRGSVQRSRRGNMQGKGGGVEQSRRVSTQGSNRGSIGGSQKGGNVQTSGEASHRGSIQGSHRGGDIQESGEGSHRGSNQGSLRAAEVQQDNQCGSLRGTECQGSNQESHRGSFHGSLGLGTVQGSNEGSHRGSTLGTHRDSNSGDIGTSLSGEKPLEKPQARARSRKSEDSSLEGCWVQHRFRSSCTIELKHERPVNFMVGLFKKGVLITAGQDGDLRIYVYPFSHDNPNLVKEVSLFPSGEVSGLCLDEERKLIFTSSTKGILFVGSVDQDIIPAKEESEEDDFGTETAPSEEPFYRSIPLISHYLTDGGSDAHNLLLERDEVEEMKRDLIEFKLKMAREAKDAYFKHQRDALDWACEMKERETAFLAREKDYNVKIKLLEHNLHTALSDKETTIQSLLTSHSQTTQQLHDYFQDKLAKELERSHISRTQAQKDRVTLEKEMKSKESIYLEKIVALERQLEDADIRVEKKIAEVRAECKKEIDHMKVELEEDLLISDAELNKAFEKLNHDVGVEKERADSIHHSLMAEKRKVMHIEKHMKETEEEHELHLETIEKLTKEVEDLKKLATELDFEKRTLRQVLIETEEKSQHLVAERKDQETKTVVRDFKIEQLKQTEGPLKKATVDLRNKLREMESHQLGHVLEMKRQGLAAGALRSKIQNLEEEAQELNNQLHEKEAYIQMFTQALCRLVEENDSAEWPNLIKQLYFTYVKEIHRTAVSEGKDTYNHLLHQRGNLERFVSILKQEIGRSEARNWNDARHYMQQNLDLLHEFGEAQRNVRRLAFLSQKYQGEMAYWKTIATRKLPSTMLPAEESLDQRGASNSRCARTTVLVRHRPSTAIPAQGNAAAPTRRPTMTSRGSTATSAALQQAKLDSELLRDAERVREQSRSSTPVADIVKPYAHRGSVPQAATLRFSFTQPQHQQQTRPWSRDATAEVDPEKILALNIEVLELRKQVATKDKEIQRLTRDQHHATGAYLPQARRASIMASIPVDEVKSTSATERKPTSLNRRSSTVAATEGIPMSTPPGSSRPKTVSGAVTGTDAPFPELSQGFPRKSGIASIESSANIVTSNSITGFGEHLPGEERRLSATELLAERRASHIHSAAEQVMQRRSSQSSTLEERRGSKSGEGEGEERRLSATSLLAERRASKLAAIKEDLDLAVAAIAAEISPRRVSGSALGTPRPTSYSNPNEQGSRRGSTGIGNPAASSQQAAERSSKSAGDARPSEQTKRRGSTTDPNAPSYGRERRYSGAASRKTSSSAASSVPERRPSTAAAGASTRTSFSAASHPQGRRPSSAAASKRRKGSSIAAAEQKGNTTAQHVQLTITEGSNLTSTEHLVMEGQEPPVSIDPSSMIVGPELPASTEPLVTFGQEPPEFTGPSVIVIAAQESPVSSESSVRVAKETPVSVEKSMPKELHGANLVADSLDAANVDTVDSPAESF